MAKKPGCSLSKILTQSHKYLAVRSVDRLVGLVVKVSVSKAPDPGFDSCLRCGDFFRVESCQ